MRVDLWHRQNASKCRYVTKEFPLFTGHFHDCARRAVRFRQYDRFLPGSGSDPDAARFNPYRSVLCHAGRGGWYLCR